YCRVDTRPPGGGQSVAHYQVLPGLSAERRAADALRDAVGGARCGARGGAAPRLRLRRQGLRLRAGESAGGVLPGARPGRVARGEEVRGELLRRTGDLVEE